MNKKAASISTVASIVLLFVVMIMLVLFLLKTRAFANKIVEDSDCKKDIMSHVTLLKVSGEAIAPNIYCPTKYYTLAGKNDADTKQQLAEALKTCWGTWGKGQLDLFKDEGYYCHMCSVIDFKDKSNRITGVSDYLAQKTIPPKNADEPELTYAEFLAGYSSEKASPDFAENYRNLGMPDSIDTSKSYAVIFLYAKGNKFIKDALEGIGSLTTSSTTTAGGAVLGGAGGVLLGIGVVKVIGGVLGVVGLGLSAPVSGTIIAVTAVGTTVAGAVWGYEKAKEVEWFSMTILSEYNKENLKKIGCQISPVKQAKDTNNQG